MLQVVKTKSSLALVLGMFQVTAFEKVKASMKEEEGMPGFSSAPNPSTHGKIRSHRVSIECNFG
jgi:hypothetical protein